MRVRFEENFDISKLSGADYNPRRLEEAKSKLLQESLKKFGIVKPLIVNGKNGILTAGHQRTNAIKAIGLTKAPVIIIDSIDRQAEIRFNLFHNSIETNGSSVKVDFKDYRLGYKIIKPDEIKIGNVKNSTFVTAISSMIIQYGEFGSIVADEDGNVILNSDYAVASKLTGSECICCVVKKETASELLKYLHIEYGEYYYDKLNVKSYNQFHCQMSRLSGNKQFKSTTYENFVIPRLNKTVRVLDFGAGRCQYADKLRKEGFKIHAYEPHYQVKGKLSIAKVVEFINDIYNDVSKNGLYDIVVVDSVYNSVVNKKFEELVSITCNAFLKKDGMFITGTRNLDFIEGIAESGKMLDTKSRYLHFLDKDNFSVTYRSGVWTMQHFHTVKSLKEMLEGYYEEVSVYGTDKNSNIYAVCKKPKPIGNYEEALEVELNMEYPNNTRHNKHSKLKNLILELVKSRDEQSV